MTKRSFIFAFVLSALILPLAANAAEAVPESDGNVSGVWLVDAVNRRTHRRLALELTIADDPMHSGVLRFVGSNVSAAFLRSGVAGAEFQVECPFTQNGENRTIVLRGTVTGDMWVGVFRIFDSERNVMTSGRFTGRKEVDGPKDEPGVGSGFTGDWLGYYEVFGERFRVRFHVDDKARDKGFLLMPDEGIRAAITGYSRKGYDATLSATWEIAELNLTAKVEFSGRMEGGDWNGDYVVHAAGKAQPLAGGSFSARKHAGRQPARGGSSGIASILARPPHPNGFLEGVWRGYYKNAGRDLGLVVEIRISENRYIGAIMLPDDRLEATVLYAADSERQAQVSGLCEPLDAEPDGDAMTINLSGELRDGEWRGEYDMESAAVKLGGPFFLTRK